MKHVMILCTVYWILGCDDHQEVFLDPSQIARVNLSPGLQRLRVTMNGKQDLLYGLSIPERTPDQKVPLIIALHYAGPATPYRGDVYMRQLVLPALAGLGAIIVAPDAPGNSWLEASSEEAVIAFIKIAIDVWPVDPDRIIITGYSMGGIGTWYLADKYPDVFWAAIPMASEPVGFLTGKVPHFIIQGQYDELFDTDEVRKALSVIRSKGRRAELVIAEGLFHSEANRYVPYLAQSIPWLTDSLTKNSR